MTHFLYSFSTCVITFQGTCITQIYNVTGYMEGGLGQLADIVDKVQTGQLNALVAQLNK